MSSILRRREMLEKSGDGSIYQQVEYIENIGSSYLIIDYYASNNSDISVKYSSSNTITLSFICGYRQAYTGNMFTFFYSNPTTVAANFGSTDTGWKTLSTSTMPKTLRLNKNGFYADGTKIASVSNTTFKASGLNNRFGVFTINDRGTGWGVVFFPGKIYSIVENNGDFNLIPVYRKSDHKPGLYDTVNDIFYTNQGSGEFVVGGPV